MPGRIGEIVRIVAYEVVRLVEIDRLGVLRPVVNGSVNAEHGILAGCQREIIPVAGELPQCLDYRHEIPENHLAGIRVRDDPRVVGNRIVRVQCPEAERVQILGLRTVVVKYYVLVNLIVTLLGIFLAAAEVHFLYDNVPGDGADHLH